MQEIAQGYVGMTFLRVVVQQMTLNSSAQDLQLVSLITARVRDLFDNVPSQHFNKIMPAIYSRFMEKEARQWRQIYKVRSLPRPSPLFFSLT